MKLENWISARIRKNARKQLWRKKHYNVSICVSNQGGGINLCYDGGSRLAKQLLLVSLKRGPESRLVKHLPLCGLKIRLLALAFVPRCQGATWVPCFKP